MSVVICPGMHEAKLTQSFLEGIGAKIDYFFGEQSQSISLFNTSENLLIFPTQNYPAVSGFHILQFIQNRLRNSLELPLLFISFSAGVVGAIQAAYGWQMLGGKISAFIALDGWGVPLYGNFPIHRLSHDYFTHWSSALGSGEDNFYADPGVEHLQLWRSPHTVSGYWVPGIGMRPKRLTAAEFLIILLKRYGEISD